MLTFIVFLTLCGVYCKFRITTIGGRIVRVIPPVVILIILLLVMMAIHSAGFGSYSAWLTTVMGVRAASLVLLMAIGMYVQFPRHVCEQCRRSPYLSTGRSELQPLHLPETEHSNSTETRFRNPHSTLTTETTPLILHGSKLSGPSQLPQSHKFQHCTFTSYNSNCTIGF